LHFLRELTVEVARAVPDALVIAEESTAWPGVTRPTVTGGLGFDYKWDLGWMHDTLDFFARDPVHRKFHQGALTFRMLYAFTEQFVLPLSHDEVVHGKGSLVSRMPGDSWQKHANLRVLYGYQYALPGKKLLFMGDEVASPYEWSHEGSFNFSPEEHSPEAGVRRWIAKLNRLHETVPALHELDHSSAGFEWIACDDEVNTVIALVRKSRHLSDQVAAIFNLTPVPRSAYLLGVPLAGTWQVAANSDASEFGGSGYESPASYESKPLPFHGYGQSIALDLPPLSALYLSHDGRTA
jgi:1,4-alpha-glucan branching enzyme